MDFAFTAEDEAFRTELREWLAANQAEFEAEFGAERETGGAGISRLDNKRRAWQKRMAEARWAAINWPREWGGREATIMQNVIYSEEMARAKAPGVFNANGIWQLGPMITKWGTDEQKQRWLPAILSADEHWCQGFSEPEAGSDPAHLRPPPIPGGGDYPLNGPKIWGERAHTPNRGV